MLKITDLLFGDYFQNLNGAIFRMDYTVFNRYINDSSFETIFSPVPLSDEILETNFPDPDILAWWPAAKDGYYHIDIEQDDSEDSLGGPEIIIKLKYVHELQHLLKICNIDKDIKLR